MATAKWLLGFNGNWLDADRWSTGAVPTSGDVRISAPGTYTVKLTAAASAHDIEIDATGLTFLETDAGSLNADLLQIRRGTCTLNGVNTIGTATELYGGLLKVGNGGALGLEDIHLLGGELLATQTESLVNAFHFEGDALIAAQTGRTLTLSGTYSSTSGSNLTLGTPDAQGTIVLDFLGGSLNSSSVFDIASGTVRAAGVVSGLFHSAACIVEAGATLDLNGHEMVVENLQGAGTITDDNASPGHINVSGGNFAGAITGDLLVTIKGSTVFTGNSTYTGGTDIFPGETLTLGDGGTTGSIKGAIIGEGTLAINRSNTFALKNGLAGDISLDLLGTGTVQIKHANSYTGTTSIHAGTLALSDGAGLGTSQIQLVNGELLATASFALTNTINVSEATIAAKHGEVFEIESFINLSGDIAFGATGADGTILFAASGGTVSEDSGITVAAGTLQVDNGTFSFLTDHAGSTTIGAGATLNAASHDLTIHLLLGDGTLTNTEAFANLTLEDAAFSGVIAGGLGVIVEGSVTLTGTSTYTGGTLIDEGAALSLGNGGNGGKIDGLVFNDGALYFARSNTFAFGGEISGSGSVHQFGDGTTRLTHANSYAGGTFIDAGILSANHNSALGSGDIHFSGGELLGGATQTISNPILFEGDGIIAAAHNKTLTLTGAVSLGSASTTLTVGTASADGTVVWGPSATMVTTGYAIDIAGGTLMGGGGNFNTVFNNADDTNLRGGATLDLGGHALFVNGLHGGGVLTNSGTSATLIITDGDFDGQLNVSQANVAGDVTLSGGGTVGTVTIFENSTLELQGNAQENVAFNDNNAALILRNPNSFDGTILDFVVSDAIVLPTIDFGGGTEFTFHENTDILEVTDGDHTVEIHFEDGYTDSDFSLDEADGHTVVLTTMTAAAFIELSPG